MCFALKHVADANNRGATHEGGGKAMKVQDYGSSVAFKHDLNEMLKLGYYLHSWQMTTHVTSDGEPYGCIVAVYKNKSL